MPLNPVKDLATLSTVEKYKLTSREFARSLYFTDDQAGLCQAFYSPSSDTFYTSRPLLCGIRMLSWRYPLARRRSRWCRLRNREQWRGFFSFGLIAIIHWRDVAGRGFFSRCSDFRDHVGCFAFPTSFGTLLFI
ncbi:hypothetical protein CEXT_87891 [Caerostris extrusa]|uniref:Uncharacterized protein n=1 Tax=Caerostris extrusa TaxID=172846 RepID=A0AAV4XP17_CAEEX|nr:hypothetical protein CEXT_87891 [Caerostris extrusa]